MCTALVYEAILLNSLNEHLMIGAAAGKVESTTIGVESSLPI